MYATQTNTPGCPSNTQAKRFERLFKRLQAAQEGAFVPFVNLCDPTPQTSLAVIEALIAGGADALELGIPFSDPCADGPVVEASAGRALAAGSTTEKCLALVRSIRDAHPELPISLMLYVNLAIAPGLDRFMTMAADAGADAVLLPDLPLIMREREAQWEDAARAAGIDLIAIAPPKARPEVLERVAHHSGGYVYLLSRAGVTGADRSAEVPQMEELEVLRQAGAAPRLLGFGVSTPQHVQTALAAGADGVIVGSAVVRFIEANLGDTEKMLAELRNYAATMKAATRRA